MEGNIRCLDVQDGEGGHEKGATGSAASESTEHTHLPNIKNNASRGGLRKFWSQRENTKQSTRLHIQRALSSKL